MLRRIIIFAAELLIALYPPLLSLIVASLDSSWCGACDERPLWPYAFATQPAPDHRTDSLLLSRLVP